MCAYYKVIFIYAYSIVYSQTFNNYNDGYNREN